MYLSKTFERFTQAAPMAVAARAAFEYALPDTALDELFGSHVDRQYTRSLLFSSVVDLMGVVVCKIQPSIHAAFQEVAPTLPVSITSVYNKLNHMEPAVASALVNHTAVRLGPVIREMGGQLPELVPGHRVRIIDGNHLAATERRIDVLRGSFAGPLPGHALVVLDPALMLVTDMIPCEDGHAQERSLFASILTLVEPDDIWIADRNFCTAGLLAGISGKKAFYVIRQHAGFAIISAGTLLSCGRTNTGDVFEQTVTIKDSKGFETTARRILIRLDKKTRDGDAEMAILTNLPTNTASAVAVAELYKKRWKLETVFQTLTQMLEGEIDTLAYPRAALLGFAIALATYNVLSTAQAALRGAFGAEKIQNEVSGYYIANEVRVTAGGMSIALDASFWVPFQTMKPETLAKQMLHWASGARLPKYKRHPRGPKNPVPKRTRFIDKTHISTARLLAEARKKSP